MQLEFRKITPFGNALPPNGRKKKAVRIISGANIKSHTEPIFKLYNLLKIADMYKSKLLILYYKILMFTSPRYFDTFLPKNSAGVSRYPIRNLDGSLLLTDIHILQALADIN